jgi:shikimate kinase
VARRHIVLVGLPGSGKTSVGALVAQRLGTQFTDLDRVIEARAGQSVPAIFAERGEQGFRALEAEAGRAALAGDPGVLAPGGGFFTDPDLRRETLATAYAVYLRTTPATAAGRLGPDSDRPLLRGYDPRLRLRLILEQREDGYLQAQGEVTTDGSTPDAVADQVAALARVHAGW